VSEVASAAFLDNRLISTLCEEPPEALRWLKEADPSAPGGALPLPLPPLKALGERRALPFVGDGERRLPERYGVEGWELFRLPWRELRREFWTLVGELGTPPADAAVLLAPRSARVGRISVAARSKYSRSRLRRSATVAAARRTSASEMTGVIDCTLSAAPKLVR